MNVQEQKYQQDLDNLQQQFKEGSDKIIEKICAIIRSHPPGQPLHLTFAKQFPLVVAQFLTAQALERTEQEGIQIFGLIVDFESD